MRSYGVLPSQVTATGPKGFILKGDVLKIVRGNNLSLIDNSYSGSTATAKTPSAGTDAKKSAAPAAKKTKKPAAKSKEPNGDAADPFVQSWADVEVTDELRPIAETLYSTKRYNGQAYMSSKSEVTQITTDFSQVSFDLFLMKAAQKAFTKIFEVDTLSVVKVDSLTDQTIYRRVEEFRIGQLADAISSELP